MAKTADNTLVDSRLFVALAGVAVFGILLTSNDILSPWNDAEALSLLRVQDGNELPGLFHWVQRLLYQNLGLNIFALRLPGVLALLATFAAFWQWGRKLFGQATVVATLLVMGSSLLLTTAAKQATGDSWLLGFQLVNFLFLLRLLKSPNQQWAIGFWASALLGGLVQPLSMMIWSGGWWAYLLYFHPKGRELKGGWGWLLVLIVLLLLIFTGQLDWKAETFLFGYGAGNSIWKYGLYNLLGCLPWLAFLLPGFRDLWYKNRKGEELSLFIAGWLLLGLLSQSLVLQAGFAFLIAKQVLNCFEKGYPYYTMAKISVTLVLVLSFFGIMLLLLGSYNLFDAAGFRAAVLVGGGYWALYFISSIGMLMKNRRLLLGGLTFSGLILTSFFWARYGPLMEQSRDVPARIVATAKAQHVSDATATFIVQQGALSQLPNLKLMAGEAFGPLQLGVELEELSKLELAEDALIVTDSVGYELVKKKAPLLNVQKLIGSYQVLIPPSLTGYLAAIRSGIPKKNKRQYQKNQRCYSNNHQYLSGIFFIALL